MAKFRRFSKTASLVSSSFSISVVILISIAFLSFYSSLVPFGRTQFAPTLWTKSVTVGAQSLRPPIDWDIIPTQVPNLSAVGVHWGCYAVRPKADNTISNNSFALLVHPIAP
ncbi:MAG: hypothetical protein EWV80_09355 [Microcystis aeruginosa Ma_QC_B_20070730_S2]|uniref:Uncharacterized protein n=1 Tax=Microcystis aeruginosa Ma_QC_B_20070730_S2 TaxID=2486256 RepID=A0A552DU73_MICAE|nr:MAG: hypothetical protein EWV80_09355 [Microcystis aeruginosa Ma_QC_B_20070730_S2]